MNLSADSARVDIIPFAGRISKMSDCECGRLDDRAVIDMGHEEAVFRTLQEVRHRGDPWWWLYASTCRVCGQLWLVASEERQNDVLLLLRLESTVAERLLNDNIWPADFDRYESLLEISRNAGKSVRFVDPMDSSLLSTILDLARERPGIRVSELASLLNLELQAATMMAREAARTAGVTITFDVDC